VTFFSFFVVHTVIQLTLFIGFFLDYCCCCSPSAAAGGGFRVKTRKVLEEEEEETDRNGLTRL
jgi:hypothetical protein